MRNVYSIRVEKKLSVSIFFSRVQLCNWTLAVHVSGIFDPLLLSGPRFTVCASFSCTGMFQCMEPGCKIIRSFLAGTYAKNMILETCYRLVSSVCLLFLLTETQDYCTAPLSHSPKMSWQMFWLRRKKEGMLFYSSSSQFQCKSSAYLISHPCIMIRSFNLMKENRPAIQNLKNIKQIMYSNWCDTFFTKLQIRAKRKRLFDEQQRRRRLKKQHVFTKIAFFIILNCAVAKVTWLEFMSENATFIMGAGPNCPSAEQTAKH